MCNFFWFLLLLLLFFLSLFFSLLQTGGLRFSVIPPLRKNTKGMFAMAAITLPLSIFSRSFYKGDKIV